MRVSLSQYSQQSISLMSGNRPSSQHLLAAKNINTFPQTASLEDYSCKVGEPRGAVGWSRAVGVLPPPATCPWGVCGPWGHWAPTHPCPPTVGSYIPCRGSQLLSLMAMEQEQGSPASSSLGKHRSGGGEGVGGV